MTILNLIRQFQIPADSTSGIQLLGLIMEPLQQVQCKIVIHCVSLVKLDAWNVAYSTACTIVNQYGMAYNSPAYGGKKAPIYTSYLLGGKPLAKL